MTAARVSRYCPSGPLFIVRITLITQGWVGIAQYCVDDVLGGGRGDIMACHSRRPGARVRDI